ncbi:MAG: hypothetical protein QM594_00600 [Niabella sp.]
MNLDKKKRSKEYQEALLKFKDHLEEEQGRSVSDREMDKISGFLDFMAKIVVDQTLEESSRKEKLAEYPDGYHFDKDGYSCIVCHRSASGENSWYDKNGLKCMCCQNAINKKIIPVSVIKNPDSYYTSTLLEISFNLKPQMIRMWIKQGLLKDRIIPGKDGKGKHLQLFLLSDNKGFLPPPKKLRVGGPVKETTPDGREEYVFYPWYYFVDPKEHLKKYGISHYFRIVPLENK